jgi:hypothetical protein
MGLGGGVQLFMHVNSVLFVQSLMLFCVGPLLLVLKGKGEACLPPHRNSPKVWFGLERTAGS